MDEIASLTDEQIVGIVFHPRDEDGDIKYGAFDPEVIEAGPRKQTTLRELFYAQLAKRDPSVTEEQMAEQFKKLYPGA